MEIREAIFVLVWAFVKFSGIYGTPIMSYKFYNPATHDYKVVCYLGSWAVYRPGDGKFNIENIDPFICTHLIYGFAGLGFDNKIRSLDSYFDLAENYGKGAFKRFTGLKKINPKLKTIIAIGGWNEGSVKYSNMAADTGSRRIFVESVVDFLKKYDFDGLDMDWEYPGARGGKPEDKVNFVSLLRELKSAFTPHGYLLTAAVSAGKHFIDPAYDIPQVSQYLDLINLMAYDYHGGWETKTGHHAAMFARPDEMPDDQLLNLNFSVNYWIEKGAPPSKIILGMGLYGRSFTLQRGEANGFEAPAPSRGTAGPYTREPGSLGYNEICDSLSREKWTIVRDPYVMAPYAYRDRQWVGYDDEESIMVKAHFAKSMKLGGGMVWSIETDDFQGKCHGKKYPLLTAINNVFADPSIKPLPVPPPAPPTPSTVVPTTPTGGTTQSTPMTWWPTQPTQSSTASSPWWTPESSTASSTTSTTTMAPRPTSTTAAPQPQPQPQPTTDAPQPDATTSSSLPCNNEGLRPIPGNCQKFYNCVAFGEGYMQYEYSCPTGTVFDPNNKSCTWPEFVPGCQYHQLKKYSFLWPYYSRGDYVKK